MSNNIVQFNEEIIKGQIKELVRGSVEETLNELLEAEAQKLTQAARYERSEARQGYRSGHYDRNLTTTSGDVTLHVPHLKGISFETAIIERYRRRESSVEEALIEDVSCRRIRAPSGGHYRGAVGQQGVRDHHQRTEQESLCSHRGLAQPSPARRKIWKPWSRRSWWADSSQVTKRQGQDERRTAALDPLRPAR